MDPKFNEECADRLIARVKVKGRTMKLTKTLGEVLYDLFGPNGCDQTTVTTDTRRMAVYKELERHGVVRVEEVPDSEYHIMRKIVRVHPAFGVHASLFIKSTLCEAAYKGRSPT